MKLLSLDSTGKTAAVAVSDGETILAEGFADEGLTHSQTLLPLIDRTLKEAGMKIEEMEAFAVTNGPGSFTGLRIGASLVKGLALERPCIGVPTLMALAFNEASCGRVAVALLDARCKQVYMGAYSFDAGAPVQEIPDQACSVEQARAQIQALGKKAILLGDGAYLLADLADGEQIKMSENNYIKGSSVAKGAMHREASGPEKLVPAYFRLSQAEREQQEKKGAGK